MRRRKDPSSLDEDGKAKADLGPPRTRRRIKKRKRTIRRAFLIPLFILGIIIVRISVVSYGRANKRLPSNGYSGSNRGSNQKPSIEPLPPPDLSKLPTERIKRYEAVRSAIRHAWKGYFDVSVRGYSVPPDDLAHTNGIPTGNDWLYHSATLHDALDTLYLANLTMEFEQAVKVVTSRNLQTGTWRPAKVFEYSLRVIGGLLGAYSVSGRIELLQEAQRATDAVLAGPFAWSPSALPRPYDLLAPSELSCWNPASLLHRVVSFLYRWGRDVFTEEHRNNSLAAMGSFGVEFSFLSKVLNDPRYEETADRIFLHLAKHATPEGDVPIMWDVMTGQPADEGTGLGSGADSFYEYLLKVPIMTGCVGRRTCSPTNRQMLELYETVVSNTLSHSHTYRSAESHSSLAYPVDMQYYFQHLLCFLPGLLALRYDNDDRLLQAKQLALGCYDTYNRTTTGLGPEEAIVIELGDSPELIVYILDASYKLRPEMIESLFVLYRKSKDPVYQELAWNIFSSIERYCRCDVGYVGLKDVNSSGERDGDMPSYFLAETLKYLLLLFGPDDYVSLDEFVFTTEAHPLRIDVDGS